MGRHQIWAGNFYTAYTEDTSKVTLAKDNFSDSGFQSLDDGTKGQYVYSRRKGANTGTLSALNLAEIRLYQCKNLLEKDNGDASSSTYPTNTSDTTAASEAQYAASNLLKNSNARSLTAT